MLAGVSMFAASALASSTASCKGISFTVLHNDHSGGVTLPAGPYTVSSPNLSCSAASTTSRPSSTSTTAKSPAGPASSSHPATASTPRTRASSTSPSRSTRSPRAEQPSCKGITFTVLHNDHSGGVTLPAGQYKITSPNLSCSAASNYFKTFLDKYNGKIPGWTGKQFSSGNGKYSKNKSKINFTVKITKPKGKK